MAHTNPMVVLINYFFSFQNRLWGFVIACFAALPIAISQKAAVELPLMNVVYAGPDNPIKIVINDLHDSCVAVKASYGKISKNGGHWYSWNGMADHDSLQLVVIDTCHQEEIAVRHYRVKKIPIVIALGGNLKYSRNSEIEVTTFRTLRGVAAMLNGFDVCGSCDMVRYQIEIYSGITGELWTKSNPGARFDAALSGPCRTLQDRDHL